MSGQSGDGPESLMGDGVGLSFLVDGTGQSSINVHSALKCCIQHSAPVAWNIISGHSGRTLSLLVLIGMGGKICVMFGMNKIN